MNSLSALIGEEERKSSGEIRIVVRHRRHWRERKLTVHQIALREFHQLGMHKTAERTGVLILLLLSDRQFQIIADEGIHRKVEEGTWDRIAQSLGAYFRDGKFVEGLSEAVRTVGAELARHFKRRPDDRDELPNEIIER